MTTDTNATFATFDLRSMPKDGVLGLSNGLLRKMSLGLGFADPKENPVGDEPLMVSRFGGMPTDASLRAFIKHVGPSKFLLDNVSLVQKLLKTDLDATAIAADWADDSEALLRVYRSFVNPGLQATGEIDVVLTGGVLRWELRRLEELIRRIANDLRVRRIFLAAGNREMAATEHHLAAAYWKLHGEGPTESEVMDLVVAPWLKFLKLDYRVIPVPSDEGSEVMARAAIEADIVNRAVLVVSNAPAGIQNAGQLRAAGRAIDPMYDHTGEQLLYLTDNIKVARKGEKPDTHASPFTFPGALGRASQALHVEWEAFKKQNPNQN